jgi:hypothetical protein
MNSNGKEFHNKIIKSEDFSYDYYLNASASQQQVFLFRFNFKNIKNNQNFNRF